jgi:hypothetical protein
MIPTQKPPPVLDPALMTPAPQAYGEDVVRSYTYTVAGSSVQSATGAALPPLPAFVDFAKNPKDASFLSIASKRVNVSSAKGAASKGAASAPINPPGSPERLPPVPPGAMVPVTSTTLRGAWDAARVPRPRMAPALDGVSPNNFALPKIYVEPTTTVLQASAPAPVAAMAPAPAGVY